MCRTLPADMWELIQEEILETAQRDFKYSPRYMSCFLALLSTVEKSSREAYLKIKNFWKLYYGRNRFLESPITTLDVDSAILLFTSHHAEIFYGNRNRRFVYNCKGKRLYLDTVDNWEGTVVPERGLYCKGVLRRHREEDNRKRRRKQQEKIDRLMEERRIQKKIKRNGKRKVYRRINYKA
jgi:hypothetical protein